MCHLITILGLGEKTIKHGLLFEKLNGYLQGVRLKLKKCKSRDLSQKKYKS